MKTLIWKLRCAREIRRLIHLSMLRSWQTAGAIVESYGIEDLTPKEAAENEAEEWLASC